MAVVVAFVAHGGAAEAAGRAALTAGALGGGFGENKPVNARDAIRDDISAASSPSAARCVAETVGCSRFLTRTIKSCG